MYTRLLAKSDDHSNYDGHPFLILTGLYNRRFMNKQITEKKVENRRDELVAVGLIQLYQVDGEKYIHIVNCKKHLRSDIKPDIRFPNFSQELVTKELAESGTKTERTRNENGSSDSTTTTDTTTSTTTINEVVFEKWNTYKGKINGWKSHSDISYEIKSAITEQQKHYSIEDLCAAIDNYADVLASDGYRIFVVGEKSWDKFWTLREFLTRGTKADRSEKYLYRFLPNVFCKDDFMTQQEKKRRISEEKSRRQAVQGRQQLRGQYEKYLQGKSIGELKEMRKDRRQKHIWFLIDVILTEKKGK